MAPDWIADLRTIDAVIRRVKLSVSMPEHVPELIQTTFLSSTSYIKRRSPSSRSARHRRSTVYRAASWPEPDPYT
ncbi:hypothetical protein ACFSE1_08580 [Rhizobium helianthi]|uniref:Uncharacterized protein n=1 Tax=Rhizobium helianthi TaxID=1132695 RepID=A0ABW4M5L2_9HYPH